MNGSTARPASGAVCVCVCAVLPFDLESCMRQALFVCRDHQSWSCGVVCCAGCLVAVADLFGGALQPGEGGAQTGDSTTFVLPGGVAWSEVVGVVCCASRCLSGGVLCAVCCVGSEVGGGTADHSHAIACGFCNCSEQLCAWTCTMAVNRTDRVTALDVMPICTAANNQPNLHAHRHEQHTQSHSRAQHRA